MKRMLFATAVISILAHSTDAGAEQPIPKSCVCNDDCVYTWPYSGICVQNSWGKTCGFSGPGIPCTDGGAPPPPPDAGPAKEGPWYGCGDAMPNCACDDDCKPHGLAYCVKHPNTLCAPICSSKGPGLPCTKKDVGTEGVTPRSCRCNADCAGIAGMPYCAYQSGSWFCSAIGPGVSCPDDPYPHSDDLSHTRDAGPGTGAAAPRGGCSVGGASTSAPGALLLLLGLALVLRRRQ